MKIGSQMFVSWPAVKTEDVIGEFVREVAGLAGRASA
jgi:hypothetical protein